MYKLISFFIIILFFSCTVDNNKSDEIVFNSKNLILKSSINVFNSIPSPIETAKIISETKVQFNKRILNPVSNVPYYETSSSMALNLGIYCADISYTSFYDQKDITYKYLSAIKTLADGLGISKSINQNDIIKIEDNLYNKDSIKVIIQDIFFSSGQYLNENNSPEIALFVEVGAWIEGLYIAMQLSTQSIHINKQLVDRVAQQSNSLDMVILSLKNYSDYTEVNNVLLDMKRLKRIYTKMKIKTAKKISTKTDEEDNNYDTMNNKVKITPEIFISLYKEINKIRNNYTQ